MGLLSAIGENSAKLAVKLFGAVGKAASETKAYMSATKKTEEVVNKAATLTSKTIKSSADTIGRHVKDLKFTQAIKDTPSFQTTKKILDTKLGKFVTFPVWSPIRGSAWGAKKIGEGHNFLKLKSSKYNSGIKIVNKVASNSKVGKTIRGSTYFGLGIMGIGYGATKVAMSNAIARSYNNKQGMDPNNLSTDGLTLALSKRRHR